MKRILYLFFMGLCCCRCLANVGLPYFVNYDSETYNAHKRNFDIVCDDYGTVYIANFEGLLYYDQAEWRMIHTPGISRITSLYRDSRGRIWVGGYNYFGSLAASSYGCIQLKALASDTGKKLMGEVTSIWETEGELRIAVSNGAVYKVVDGKLDKLSNDVAGLAKTQNETNKDYVVNQKMVLENGWTVYATSGKGLVVFDGAGNELFGVSEENGLCSNNVSHIALSPQGGIWGATDNGIFYIDIPSVYSHYTSSEGLKGEVVTIQEWRGKLYVGTLQGLFQKEGNRFKPILPITQVCWQLQKTADGKLLAATGDGLYQIDDKGIKRITNAHSLSVLPDGVGHYYTGELDAVYYNSAEGKRERLADIEKVVRLSRDSRASVWAETMYGKIWYRKDGRETFQPVDLKENTASDNVFVLFRNESGVYLVDSHHVWSWNAGEEKFNAVQMQEDMGEDIFPQFSYLDDLERSWFTDSEGKNLFAMKKGKRLAEYIPWLRPLSDLVVRAMAVEADGDRIWIGGGFGLLCWQPDSADQVYKQVPDVFIRSVVVNRDSVKWGGYSQSMDLRPETQISRLALDSDCRNIRVTFSSDHASAFGKTVYRYRLKGDNDWSAWTTETSVQFNNLWYGRYVFQVMARSIYGQESSPSELEFTILYPLYLKWYAIICYILLLGLLIFAAFKLRMRRLLKEKEHLEGIVEQRTSQLRRQKEEIEEKSRSLEQALDDLGKAQNDLIRQEKMATVGTLTKGLIDRILNPMNYINNFSRLTVGLVKDMGDNLEDDKENMSHDIYEDSVDVLDMIRSNLQKIEEHGVNTTRILKAMEEMLKDRSGNMSPVDIAAVCRKNFEMLNTYYASEINKYNIRTEMDECQEFIAIEANAEQLSKTIMSLLGNSMYAVMKKCSREKEYAPLIRMTVNICAGSTVCISIYDNGIGIEETIADKIFDPFFTTKTTGEASGVGLYLSREIVQNHGGDITVTSRKDEYSEFVISLPVKNEK